MGTTFYILAGISLVSVLILIAYKMTTTKLYTPLKCPVCKSRKVGLVRYPKAHEKHESWPGRIVCLDCFNGF